MDGFRSRSEHPFPLSIFSPALTLVIFAPQLTLTPPACISILKMFSADKKRVETALESCGLNFNRVCGAGAGAREGGVGWVSRWVPTLWNSLP